MRLGPGSAPPALVATVLAAMSWVAPAVSSEKAAVFNCLADSVACPEISIQGDPVFELPGAEPSPFRGYGDPSLRRDPASARLWMSYSYLSILAAPGNPATAEATVSVHLASSDDGGDTWRFRRSLWPSRIVSDDAAPEDPGVSVHEVSTIAPLGDGPRSRWYGMHLRYFDPFGPEGRRPGSFLFQLGRSRSARKVARGRQARLGGPLTDAAWELDLDLSTLAPELADCAVWTEPSLFGHDEELYLVAQCLVIDLATGTRNPRREFLGVFAAREARVDRLDWRWVGKLTDRGDARALGGDVLTQPEVTTARDGALLLLVTPKSLAPEERHLGCRVLELESLEPPRLLRRRGNAGKPIVRADVRSSDSTGLGPGLCTYDPASTTGIVLVRTEVDLAPLEIVFRMHATGLHP